MSALQMEEADIKYFKWLELPRQVIHVYKETGTGTLHINRNAMLVNIIQTNKIPGLAQPITESEFNIIQEQVLNKIFGLLI